MIRRLTSFFWHHIHIKVSLRVRTGASVRKVIVRNKKGHLGCILVLGPSRLLTGFQLSNFLSLLECSRLGSILTVALNSQAKYCESFKTHWMDFPVPYKLKTSPNPLISAWVERELPNCHRPKTINLASEPWLWCCFLLSPWRSRSTIHWWWKYPPFSLGPSKLVAPGCSLCRWPERLIHSTPSFPSFTTPFLSFSPLPSSCLPSLLLPFLPLFFPSFHSLPCPFFLLLFPLLPFSFFPSHLSRPFPFHFPFFRAKLSCYLFSLCATWAADCHDTFVMWMRKC